MKIQIYSDGSSKGNPGKGGYGTIISCAKKDGTIVEKELSCGYKKTTNNRMELLGVIAGLEALKYGCDVEVYTDSSYVVNAFNRKWIDGWIKKNWIREKNRPVLNKDLWVRLLNAMKIHNVTFTWVKGHAGHSYNERCDKLAVAASDKDNLLEDTNYLH